MSAKYLGETSYKETAFGIIGRSKLIPLEIEGIKRAWDFVLERRRKGKIGINPALIKKLHSIGFAWIFPKMGGKFRTIDVIVSQHTPPKFYLVPELMFNFCKDLNARLKHLPPLSKKTFLDSLIELLTWVQHKFLWVHPFQDYNGRIARLLTNTILLNLNLPPIELKIETKNGRKRYVSALQKADKGELTALEKIIKAAFLEATKKLS